MTPSNLNTGLIAAVASLALLCPARADLHIYEPFDYPTTGITSGDGTHFGNGTQMGATGLSGAWSTLINNIEMEVRDEAMTFTDGGGNELPVAGLSIRRSARGGFTTNSIAVQPSATAALTADNTTMWMSFLYEDEGFSGPDSSVMLASDPLVLANNHTLEVAGNGVGILIGESAPSINATVETGYYLDSATSIRTQSTLNPNDTENTTYLFAAKVNWKPDGTPDEIYVFNITDLSTEPLEADAIASDTFDMPLASQQALDTLNIGETQIDAFDEIRFGTTFEDVTGGGTTAGSEFAITAIDYSPETNEVTLTWTNSGAAAYVVKYSSELTDWGADLDDGIEPDIGETTTETFTLVGDPEVLGDLFFRIEEQ